MKINQVRKGFDINQIQHLKFFSYQLLYFHMNKYHSFQLPRVNLDGNQSEPAQQQINQQAAQQCLYEISRNEDSPKPSENLWKELTKLSMIKKRYQKSSNSIPKKKPLQLMPVIDIKSFRSSSRDLNLQILNTTRYMVIDERQAKTDHMEKAERNSQHYRINRKAKMLFRSKNKAKLPSLAAKEDLFSASFYCSKINQDGKGA